MQNLVCRPTVVLPRMSAATSLAVGQSLHTALWATQNAQVQTSAAQAANTPSPRAEGATPEPAVPVAIPATVAECMSRLDAVCQHLAATRPDGATAPTPNRSARRARRKGLPGRYRKAWFALEKQLHLWRGSGLFAKLPSASREVLTGVFGEDLRVSRLQTDGRSQWTLGSKTFAEKDFAAVEAIFRANGAEDLVTHLRSLHDELGVAFGVTAAVSVPAPPVTTAALVTEVQDVMREYVLKVHAMVSPIVPGSEALAAQLLAPLADLVRSQPSKAAKTTKATKTKDAAQDARPDPVVKDTPAEPLRPTGTG
jgi:hypothetical protein